MPNIFTLPLTLLALLLSLLSPTQASYATYSYLKGTTYYNGSALVTTGLAHLAFTSNLAFMAIVQTASPSLVQIHVKTTNNYTFAYTVLKPNFQTNPILTLQLVGTESLAVLVLTYPDKWIQTFKIQRDTFDFITQIYPTAQSIAIIASPTILIVRNPTVTEVYRYNGASYTVVKGFGADYTTNQDKLIAASSDGLYLIRSRTGTVTTLDLYRYNSGMGTYTTVSSVSVLASDISVRSSLLLPQSGSSYNILLITQESTTFKVRNFTINTGTHAISAVSTISTGQSGLVVDNNYTYNLDGSAYLQLMSIRLVAYQHNFAGSRYDIVRNIGIYANSVCCLYINSANFLAVGFAASSSSGTPAQPLVKIYYKCQVLYCTRCSFINVCELCDSGYTMINSSYCGCGVYQSLVNGSCISCRVAGCESCWMADVCGACEVGYQFSGISCVLSTLPNVTVAVSTTNTTNSTGTTNTTNTTNTANTTNTTNTATDPQTTSADTSFTSKQAIFIALISAVLAILLIVVVGFIIMASKLQTLTQTSGFATKKDNRVANELNQTEGKIEISEPAVRVNDISAEEFVGAESFEPLRTRKGGKVSNSRSMSEKTRIEQLQMRSARKPG